MGGAEPDSPAGVGGGERFGQCRASQPMVPPQRAQDAVAMRCERFPFLVQPWRSKPYPKNCTNRALLSPVNLLSQRESRGIVVGLARGRDQRSGLQVTPGGRNRGCP